MFAFRKPIERTNMDVLDLYVIDTCSGPTPGTAVRLLDRRPISGDFVIQLASGMCHAFATEEEARASQYWPSRKKWKKRVRPLHEIAHDITRNWDKVFFTAVPTLEVMKTLERIEDDYIVETARSVVTCFLANAGSWKGIAAKRIKKELNELLEE